MKLAKVYAAITKAEAQSDGTVKVWGYASSEAVDSDGETITADAMKAALPDYMKWGAVREMHQSKAAGTAIEASVEADGRTFFGCHIVDSEAVKKVNAGVYKGFSIGGKVLERDNLNKTIIKGIKLVEVSLVDRPANPEAVFTVIKAEDARTPEDDVNELAELLDKGEITPAQVLELVKAAKENTADAQSVADEASAAADKASADAETASDKADSSDDTDDDQAASDAHQSAADAHYKAAALTTSKAARKKHNRKASMHQSQAWQLSTKAATADEVAKAGKTISEASMAQLKKAHDAIAQLGGCPASSNDDADKVAKAHAHEELAKVQGDLAKAMADLDALKAENTKLKAAPAHGKALLKAVVIGKGADVSGATDPAAVTVEPVKKSDGSIDQIATLVKSAHLSPRAH
jgi:phage head maturation protease